MAKQIVILLKNNWSLQKEKYEDLKYEFEVNKFHKRMKEEKRKEKLHLNSLDTDQKLQEIQ